MTTASRDSSPELRVEPLAGIPGGDRPAATGTAIWLDGGVLACACPDCGAPMSIRLWLATADCWRCGASIELTEEQEQEALRLLEGRDAAGVPRVEKPVGRPMSQADTDGLERPSYNRASGGTGRLASESAAARPRWPWHTIATARPSCASHARGRGPARSTGDDASLAASPRCVVSVAALPPPHAGVAGKPSVPRRGAAADGHLVQPAGDAPSADRAGHGRQRRGRPRRRGQARRHAAGGLRFQGGRGNRPEADAGNRRIVQSDRRRGRVDAGGRAAASARAGRHSAHRGREHADPACATAAGQDVRRPRRQGPRGTCGRRAALPRPRRPWPAA